MLSVSKSEPASYAVTLATVKNYLALDHTGFDDLIEDVLIPGAQDQIEQATGLILTEQIVTAFWDTFSGEEELPFAPYAALYTYSGIGITVDGEEAEEDAYTITGTQYPVISGTETENLEVTYTAGYTTIPAGLKQAVLKLIAHNFANRGDTEAAIPKEVLQMLLPYTRNLMI